MLLVILTSVVLSQGDQKCIQVSGTCTAYEDSSGNKDAECTVKYANPYSPNIKYIGKSLYTSLTHILYIHTSLPLQTSEQRPVYCRHQVRQRRRLQRQSSCRKEQGDLQRGRLHRYDSIYISMIRKMSYEFICFGDASVLSDDTPAWVL